MSLPEPLGHVTADYVHVTKLARPGPRLVLDEAVLKWYDVAPADAPVPLELRAQARAALAEASDERRLGLSGDLGFVILHRCGPSFAFLLVSTWRNDNEL
jgi:hypothetical protein